MDKEINYNKIKGIMEGIKGLCETEITVCEKPELQGKIPYEEHLIRTIETLHKLIGSLGKEALDYKERLKVECMWLIPKVNALNAFKGDIAFYKLDRPNKDLMYEQSRIMDEYIQILGKRMELAGITDFKKETNE